MKNIFYKILLFVVLITTTTIGLPQVGVRIDIKAVPTATINDATYNICLGQSQQITVILTNGNVPEGWWDVTFTDGTNPWTVRITSSPYILTVTPPTTTAYSITRVWNGECPGTFSGTALVIIKPAPQIYTLSCANPVFCQGGISNPLAMNGSVAGDMYQLLRDGLPVGGPIMGTGIPFAFAGQSLPGTYTVRATNPTGCTSIMNGVVVLVMNPLPGNAGPITGPTTVCAGSTATYTTNIISDATSYVWSVPMGSTIINGQGTTTITVQFGLIAGNISVFGTNACGGGQPSLLAVTVNLAPTLNITVSDNPICRGEYTDITANSNGNSYFWTPGNYTTQSIHVNPLVTTTYTCVVTGSNSCTTTGTQIITVNTPPIVVLDLDPFQVCTDTPPFLASSITGGSTPPGGTSTSECIQSNGWVYPSISGAGTWPWTYTFIDANGCIGSDTKLFTINPVPSLVLHFNFGLIDRNTPPFDLGPYASQFPCTMTGDGMITGTTLFDASKAPANGICMITVTYVHPITGCSVTEIGYINVTPVGINEFKLVVGNINIFPNPADNQLNISTIDAMLVKSIRIVNLSGQVVFTTEAITENMQINVSGYAPGEYIIAFGDADGHTGTQPFIKNQ